MLTARARVATKWNDSARAHCCRIQGRYPNKPAAEEGENVLNASRTSLSLNIGAEEGADVAGGTGRNASG